jgi:microcystin-dependent protein
MPFNGTGTFTIINTFVPNTTILSAAVNQNFTDIASGLSDCLTRDGQAGMTATLGITSGNVHSPGLAFNSELGSGLYLAGTGQIGIAVTSNNAFSLQVASTAAGAGILGLSGAVVMPIGTIFDYAGSVLPTGWFFCYGQEFSRSVLPLLFAVIGTAWGSASTATAFLLPDLRGRAVYGKDDMGGTPANRITNAVSGVVGTTLGASGGAQSQTLDSTQVPATSLNINTVSLGTINTTPSFANFVQQGGAGGDNLAGGGVTHTVHDLAVTIPNFTPTGTVAGGGLAHPILNPAAIVNKIIFAGQG